MREILFRGKRKNNCEWVCGEYITIYDDPKYKAIKTCIELNTGIYEVDRDTVCQYTGLTDKSGKKIFEGDICHFYGGESYSGFWETEHTCEIEFCHECFWYLENAEYVEVIGNMFDNPELMRGVEE